MGPLRLYANYFSIHLKTLMQYKVSFSLTMLGQIITSFSTFLSIWFMFSRFNEVEGFNFSEVMLCFAVVLLAFSLSECFALGFDTFPQMIGNGEFDRILIRPRGLVFQVLASKVELTRMGRALQAVVVFCYAIPASGVNWTAGRLLTLVLMIVCGCVVYFALFLIYASFSFFTLEGLEFMNILTDGTREFGRYPFVVYGKPVLRFLTYVVPVALIQYYPLLFLLDRETGLFYRFSPLFSLLFLVPAFWFWRFSLRRYKSTGS